MESIDEKMVRRSLMNKSRIEYTGYCINHYWGCSHGCLYPCYARLIRRVAYADWIRPKVASNAVQLLEDEILKGRNSEKEEIMVSSMCDPYQPINRRYGLTRKIVRVLMKHHFPILIQTKSPDVISDLSGMDGHEKLTVGMTIVCLDEEKRRQFEPYAPPIKSRILALQKVHEMGFRTRVSSEPLLPGTPFQEITAMFDQMRKYVDEWIIGALDHARLSPADVEYYRRLKPFLQGLIKKYGLNARFKQVRGAFP